MSFFTNFQRRNLQLSFKIKYLFFSPNINFVYVSNNIDQNDRIVVLHTSGKRLK